ncbi:MAG TPA: TonB-dependent receptor [Rhizomicrobium sp.]|nr:TonB-dependent receptor [Rhizomicrobium sp.]
MIRRILFAGAAGAALCSGAAHAQAVTGTETVTVTAQKLNEARNGIQTQLGASTYTITENAIAAMPGGANNSFNQLILQAPGVVQDQFGQLHIRAEHNALQYRLNGVILPEGISVFSQTLDPRLAGSIKLITGALPAEYGLITGGIVDVQTKSGLFDSGGEVAMYGGSHGQIQPSASFGGSKSGWNYFVTGDYLQSDVGIDSPDGSAVPFHDFTTQYHAFGYAENIIDQNSRIAVMLGSSHDNFEIPDQFGQMPQFPIDGITPTPSQLIDSNQHEITHFGSVSYLRSDGPFNFQISAFGRYSSLAYSPDPNLADLSYLGISQLAYKRDIGYGLQFDGAYKLNDAHTLRAGFLAQQDDIESNTTAQVLPATCATPICPLPSPPAAFPPGTPENPFTWAQSANTPFTIVDNSQKGSSSFSVYLQDEWQILKQLTLNYGVRYDRYTSFSEGNAVSPRANLVWKPLDGTTIHAGYARYFSPPPVELVGSVSVNKFLNSTAAPAVTLDDTPVAEHANYYDVGAEQQLSNAINDGDALTLGVDSFLKLSHDLLDEGQFGAPIILTPFNYKRGKQYGLELSMNYDSGPYSMYGNIAFDQAAGKDIVSSQFNFGADELLYIRDHYIQLDHMQAMTASGGVSYLWSGTRFSLDMLAGTGLRRQLVLPGGQVIPNGGHVPAYAQVNFGVSHGFTLPAIGDFEVRFDVINLLDAEYQIRSGTGVGVGQPSFGPRRGFFAGITKAFD